MTSIISAADQTRYRTILAQSLNDTGTITRTGASLPCRLSPNQSLARAEVRPVLFRQQTWIASFNYGTDVQVGDILTMTGLTTGTYLVLQKLSPLTIAASTDVVVISVTIYTGSTKRAGVAHLTGLKLYGFPIGLMLPLTSREEIERFSESVNSMRLLYTAWPSGNTEDQPIAVGDQITLPATIYSAGGTYNVAAVEVYPGIYIRVYVDVPEPA